jgi:excisionase family DNA binding protein
MREHPSASASTRLTEHTVERKAISIMKACELVGVSRRTIYNWISGGKVEYVRTAGGSIRIFVDSLWRDVRTELPAMDQLFPTQYGFHK